MPVDTPTLAPPLRDWRPGDGRVALPSRLGLRLPALLAGSPAVERLLRTARVAGIEATVESGDPWLTARLAEGSGLPAEGYELAIGPAGAGLAAGTADGLRHGLTSLTALLAAAAEGDRRLLSGRVRDWPDFPTRGLMLDVSRNKVPTPATLEALVDLLAELKLNQLQLYTEHTFAYAGHEEVWRDSGALTADDVRRLDDYCQQRGIELVPNQNSFGHFHRWLRHDRYRPLAECPQGVRHPWSRDPEPFSLCPTDPGTLDLLADLYSQLLPNFRSSLFNVGLDETFDLGRGRSRAACEERGRGAVYLDFLRRVHRLIAGHGRRMLFWADIAVETPEIVPELPADAIGLLWGYEASHPFAEQCELLSRAGLEFWICPGTSSWNSFTGRWTNARDNLAAAARAGARHGASGYLITDWGDNGHLQTLPTSLPGLVAGASFAWNAAAADRPDELPVARLLDRILPVACGSSLLALADVYRGTTVQLVNGTVPFRLLVPVDDPLTQRGLERLDVSEVEACRAELARVGRELGALAGSDPEGELVLAELAWGRSVLDLAYDLGLRRLAAAPEGRVEDMPRGDRHRLAASLAALIEERRGLWLARHRPQGLDDSLAYLDDAR
ncbi:MAG: beta-N-acetylhexosaminidase, partial [Thermoanaerobaculia bacterium]|nr:beta-N-acetylhexosaminidase [Thermoanaerobaculia bacterium]